jgi:sulfur carrier protein
MNITINGKERILNNGHITVSVLLKQEKVESPDMVSVQVNGAFLDRKDYETTCIKEKDEVEFLYFMGGGTDVLIKEFRMQ